MHGEIYKATCLKTGKSYIGQTVQGIKVRWKGHVYDAFHSEQRNHFRNAIRKHGPDSWTLESIAQTDSQNKLDDLERYYIKRFDTFKNGYNSTTGGEHPKWRKESRRKLSISLAATANTKLRNKIFVLLRCNYDTDAILWFFKHPKLTMKKWQTLDRYKEISAEITECQNLVKYGLDRYKKNLLDWEMEEAISGLSH